MEFVKVAASSAKKRIFWLGAHKLLVGTELARLRELGYEVFNTPYLSHVLDQSASSSWVPDSQSTLPKDVYDRLCRCNFFYTSIAPDIAEILNAYFDIAVVTIVARWATEVLRVFKGPCIFRSYGQTSSLSDNFESIGARRLIEGRDDFHFYPHAEETLAQEDPWLRERGSVVPYCLSADVFAADGRWNEVTEHDGNIFVGAPNIAGNPFHLSHYHFLKEFFYHKHYRYAGVQFIDVNDPQVVGYMHRGDQLNALARSSGYLYTYRDPRVCYLPPIEMMVLGAPVVYLSGSLLARYIGAGGPGEAKTVADAIERCDRLRSGDRGLVREIVSSQRAVRERYDPAQVWPVFDIKMREAVESAPRRALTPANRETASAEDLRHFIGAYIHGLTMAPHEDGTSATRLLLALTKKVPEDADVLPISDMLNTSGSAAAIREIFAGNPDDAASLDVKGDSLLKTVAASPFEPTNLLSVFGVCGVGRSSFDTALGERVITAGRGESGFLHFGPYLPLPCGHYRIEVRFRQYPSHIEVGIVDVLQDGIVVCQRKLIAESTDPQTLVDYFVVTEPGKLHEFRTHASGHGRLDLFSFTCEHAYSEH